MRTLTQAQFSFISSLMVKKVTPAWVIDYMAKAEVGLSDGSEASRAIDELKDSPWKQTAPKALPDELVPVGFYFYEEEVYKVKPSQGDKTRRYAHKFVTDGKKGRYAYAAGMIFRLRPEHKVTVEQAAKIGHITGVCCICGRELTVPASVAAGIGPVCAAKWCA